MKVVDYVILTSVDPLELVKKVKQLINADWKPQGGLTVMVDGQFSAFMQAMVKEQ